MLVHSNINHLSGKPHSVSTVIYTTGFIQFRDVSMLADRFNRRVLLISIQIIASGSFVSDPVCWACLLTEPGHDVLFKPALWSLFVFLLEGFDGVEAAGGVDLTVAGVFWRVVEETLNADKGKVSKNSTNLRASRTFQGSLLKVFILPSEWLQIALTLRPLTSLSLAAFCAGNGSL